MCTATNINTAPSRLPNCFNEDLSDRLEIFILDRPRLDKEVSFQLSSSLSSPSASDRDHRLGRYFCISPPLWQLRRRLIGLKIWLQDLDHRRSSSLHSVVIKRILKTRIQSTCMRKTVLMFWKTSMKLQCFLLLRLKEKRVTRWLLCLCCLVYP